MLVLVYLEWKEKCFRVNEGDLRCLKKLLPRNAKVVRIRNDAALLKALPKASHVITWHFKPEWYKLAPKLKLVSTPAAGKELVALAPKGIKNHFGHFHGALMAENVAGFMLAWARGILLRRPTNWSRAWLSDKTYTVAGTKAVIIGYGKVGRAIGVKLKALGVEVHGFSRHHPIKSSVLRGLSPDWFILAVPSTTGTDDLVDAKMLTLLPKKCVLINVGRGNAVDERALELALRRGTLAAAYLDVLKYEPSGTVPLFKGADKSFLNKKIPNCFITPHSSAFSADYIKICFKELKDDGVI